MKAGSENSLRFLVFENTYVVCLILRPVTDRVSIFHINARNTQKFQRMRYLYNCAPHLPTLGSHGAFRRVYEGPIVQSRQPTATPEEREIGETRANEVNILYGVCIFSGYLLISSLG